MIRISVVDRLTGWRERPLVAAAVVMTTLGACAASLIVAPGLPGYLGAGLALIAMAIAVIDARYFVIPNELSAAAFALALVNAAVMAPFAIEIAALAAIAVFGLRHYAKARAFDPALKFPFGLFLAPSIWLGWLIEATLLAPA